MLKMLVSLFIYFVICTFLKLLTVITKHDLSLQLAYCLEVAFSVAGSDLFKKNAHFDMSVCISTKTILPSFPFIFTF